MPYPLERITEIQEKDLETKELTEEEKTMVKE